MRAEISFMPMCVTRKQPERDTRTRENLRRMMANNEKKIKAGLHDFRVWAHPTPDSADYSPVRVHIQAGITASDSEIQLRSPFDFADFVIGLNVPECCCVARSGSPRGFVLRFRPIVIAASRLRRLCLVSPIRRAYSIIERAQRLQCEMQPEVQLVE